ncbi:MAG: LPXTG cell wall anchor domain-containing protein [Gammaproteobacteria bacterium]|nr:LPXTG cell wall anchor domain-containing protein [Gammaproteobacteria bacterium]
MPTPVFAAQAVDASGESYLLALGLAVIGITGLVLIRKQSSLL